MKRFLKEAITHPFNKERRFRSSVQKTLRVLYFSVKGFHGNECFLKSSILTFYALISIVPILAIIFAIAKGFGLEDFLQKEILSTFKQQTDVLSTAIQFAYAFIGNIKGQAIAGLGIFFLFFSVFGLFENLEKSINSIWNVQKHRAFLRRAFNYMAALIVFPIIFIASTSMTLFIHSEVQRFIENVEFLHYASPYVIMALHVIPYALMCALFSYIYIFVPNTRIYLTSRIFAGIIAGVLFQCWQILYIEFQLYISSYNVIYGSFAALPLFLIWLQVNFVILFYGAEIAAHIEGDKYFKGKEKFRTITHKRFTLLVLHEITSHYLKGGGLVSIDHISRHLGASPLDTREALDWLEKAGVIAEIIRFRSMEMYQLIVNPERITVKSISDFMDKTSLRQIVIKETHSLAAVESCWGEFEKAFQNSGANLNLKDFAHLKLPDNEK